MKKIFNKQTQKAQGMVEFALVLPILLLIILGIIGMGHLFFSYSAATTASREAARFGSAVGVTDANVPRYLDCDAIIEHAVSLGQFAGVNTGNVTVEYDKGPGTAVFGSCPFGGTADTDGQDIELGDRIIVTIGLTYNTIVPIVPIPSFPLTSSTRRTIVRSLEIGDAPTAEPICPQTVTSMTIMGEDSLAHTTHSVVGQPVPFTASVARVGGGTAPTTPNSLYLYDSTTATPIQMTGSPYTAPATPGGIEQTYWHVGTYLMTAEYIYHIWDPGACYEDSSIPDQPHIVDPASTTLVINPPLPVQWGVGTGWGPMPVTVNLSAVAPGARQTWAGVTVTVLNETSTVTCTATLNAAGTGSCNLPLTILGANVVSASYAGDADYLPSAAAAQTVVVDEPDLITPPPATPIPTQIPATPIPTDPLCPRYINFTFDDDNGQMIFNVENRYNYAITLTAITVTWPTDIIANLTEIRFDTNHMDRNCWAGGNPSCIWYDGRSGHPGVPPGSFSVPQPLGNNQIGSSRSREMRVVFNRDLTFASPERDFTVDITTNQANCPHIIVQYP